MFSASRWLRFLSCAAVLVGAAAVSAHAGHKDPDRIRLTATDAPDPFSPPAQSSKLSCIAYLRKVAGLRAADNDDDDDCDEDRHGSRNHPKSFEVTVHWTISSSGTVIREIDKTIDVVPPLTFVKLKLQGSNGSKKFAQIPLELTWDGKKSNGLQASAGTYSYAAIAEFKRTHTHGGNTTVKLIDESDPVNGGITIIPAGTAPTIAVTRPTEDLLTNEAGFLVAGNLTGTAPIQLTVNGVSVPVTDTSFGGPVPLVEGPNSLEFSATNAFGSSTVVRHVTLDTVRPATPTANPLPAFTTAQPVTVSGTKESGSGIAINGVTVVPPNAAQTWSISYTLTEGANPLRVQAIDAAGNLSAIVGNQFAAVVQGKPVIRNLDVAPAEITAGQSAQVSYRLFASNVPETEGDFDVVVRIEAGDLLIKQLFAGTLRGTPSGPTFIATWDGTDSTGQVATVNTSYRVVVSAVRSTPSTAPPELRDANPKETAVLLTGSQHVSSADKRLEIVFRPDDAKLTIKQNPTLQPAAAKLLTTRRLHPVASYQVEIDRPFAGSALGVFKPANSDGVFLRPYIWDATRNDWQVIPHSNWNPVRRQLTFGLPSVGKILLASTNDLDAPYALGASLSGAQATVRLRDDTSGLLANRVRVLRNGQPLTSGFSVQAVSASSDLLVRVGEVSSLATISIYAEDQSGNGRLIHLGEGTAP